MPADPPPGPPGPPDRLTRLAVVGIPFLFCAVLTGTVMEWKSAASPPLPEALRDPLSWAGAVGMGAAGALGLVALLRAPRGIGPSRFVAPAYVFAGLFGVMAYIVTASGLSFLLKEQAGLGGTGDILANILGWVPAVMLAWRLEQRGPDPLLPWGPALGLAAWPAVLLAIAPIGMLNLGLLDACGVAAPQQGVMTAYQAAPSAWEQVLFIVGICAVAPIAEEFVFRGVLYRGMRDLAGKPAAVVGSALLFTAIHLSPTHVFGVFFVGCMLALLYERTGTLTAPIALHATHNTAALFLSEYAA